MVVNSKALVAMFFGSVIAAFLLPKTIEVKIEGNAVTTALIPPDNLNAALPDFSKIRDIREKKASFFRFLEPLVTYANQQIMQDRELVLRAKNRVRHLSVKENKRLLKLAESYRVPTDSGFDAEFFARMLKRVDTIPPALALAQAANESAWGTSRFAREGNNLFGEWCFKRGCGIKPSLRDDNASHEVARFDRVYDSIRSYMLNLNRHDYYTHLRTLREDLRQSSEPISATALAEGLERYSTRGPEYVKELQSMIRVNSLEENYRQESPQTYTN